MKKRCFLLVAAVLVLFFALQVVTESSSKIDFYGQTLDINSRGAAVRGDEVSSTAELVEALRRFPRLEFADLGIYRVDITEADALRAALPGIELRFDTYVTLYGRQVSSEATELELVGLDIDDTRELREALAYLPQCRRVTLDPEYPLPHEERDALSMLFPNIEFDMAVTRCVCGIRFREDSEELDLTTAAPVNMIELAANLAYFPRLRRIVLSDSDPISAEARRTLQHSFPGVEIKAVTTYELFGMTLREDVERIDIPAAAELTDDLPELLRHFSALRVVTLEGDRTLPIEIKRELERRYPQVSFQLVGAVEISGISVRDDAESLDLSGRALPTDLSDRLALLPALRAVDLRGSKTEPRTLIDLITAHPDIAFEYDITVGGISFARDAAEVSLEGAGEFSTDDVRMAISLMSTPKLFDLGDCGLDNDVLAALRSEYTETEIVWLIHLGQQWSLKTNAVAFSVLIYNYDHVRLTSSDIEVLKYCTDLRALDLGHQAITDLTPIAEYLPELRVLILADNRIRDLTPLSKLKHLHYLELFVNSISDLSPLAECRELVDLNISYNYDIFDIEPLTDLPLLERLWIEACSISDAEVDRLREIYPYTKIVKYGRGSVDQGWRTHARYYDMIDMFHKKNYVSYRFTRYDNKTESLLTEPLL